MLGWGAGAFTRPDTRAETVELPRLEHVISMAYVARASESATAANGVGTPVTAQSVANAGGPPPLYAPELANIDLVFQYEMRSPKAISVTGNGGTALRITAQDGWERTLSLSPSQPLAAGAHQTLWSTLDLEVVRLIIDGVEFATGSRSQWYDLTLVPVVRLFGELGGAHIDETYAPEFHWRYSLSRLTPDASLARQKTEYERVNVVRDVDVPWLALPLGAARWIALVIGAMLLIASLAVLRRRDRAGRNERSGPGAGSVHVAAAYVSDAGDGAAPGGEAVVAER